MELSNEIYTLIYVVTALVNIVLLICFFVLAANVAKIKKKLLGKGSKADNSLELYYKYRAAGQKQKAADALHDLFWEKTRLHQYCYTAGMEPDKNNLTYSQAVSLYGSLFEAINEPIPKQVFGKSKE